MRILTKTALFAALAFAAGCDAGRDPDDESTTDSGDDTVDDTELPSDSASESETEDTDDLAAICDGGCVNDDWNECTCDVADPCGWSNDGLCNGYCVELGIVDEMFDESEDCVGECTGLCQSGVYVPCTCALSDPCEWSNDGYCDDACILSDIVEQMFDDGADCVIVAPI